MQAAGINLIKTGEGAWVTFEPAEGRFDFSWMDRAIQVFSAHGIKFILGTPSYSAPAWLFAKYPDVAAVDNHGVRSRFGTRQINNFSSPHYVAAVKRIVAEMGRHYKDNPNVLGFSIDNEIGGPYSYDEQTHAAFVEWLKAKYGTLESLNKAWGMVFWGLTLSDWNQAPIPWNGQLPNPSMALDFDRFYSDYMNAFVALQVDILKQTAPAKPTTQNGMGLFDTIDYSKMFSPVTFAAFDHYPDLGSDEGERSAANYFAGDIGNDVTRGFKQQNFMVMEEMTGMGAQNQIFNINFDAALIRSWTYQSIAHGADIINYYRWRQCWFGAEQQSVWILNADSYAGDRYRVVAQVGKELPVITGLLKGSTVPSDVALLLSPDSRWAFHVQKYAKNIDYDRQVINYYKALRQMRTNVDIVFPQQDFTRYKVIIAPSLLVVDHELTAKLTEFVNNGGTLLLTFLSGAKDENNWVTQTTFPGLLKDLTGSVVRDFDPQIEQAQEVVMSDGSRYPAATWFDILEPQTAKVLATYTKRFYSGKAAITKNRYGKGLTYYVGIDVDAKNNEFYRHIVSTALRDSGITPGELVPNGVEVAYRQKAGKKIFFVLNYNDKPNTVAMDQKYLNALTGKIEPQNVELAPYDVKVLTAP
jgi:beta-galactosidase